MNKKEPPPRSRREATQFEFVFGKRHEIDSDESSDEDTSEVQYNFCCALLLMMSPMKIYAVELL